MDIFTANHASSDQKKKTALVINPEAGRVCVPQPASRPDAEGKADKLTIDVVYLAV